MSPTPGDQLGPRQPDLLPGTTRALGVALAEAQRDWRAVGVSAGVVRDGALVWSAHAGSAALDPPRAATDDTPYLIGSVTKTFTAVLVLALRDEGLLSLDDPLEAHLPGTGHGTLTIRQLLSHTSGLQREPVGRIWESLEHPDADRLLADTPYAEAVLPPHLVFHYSNLAFALLGQVVERLAGEPWETVLRRRVLEPLGMTRTGLTPDESTRAVGYHVHPYTSLARPEPVMELRAGAPLGGLWSTVADLARYAGFLATGHDGVLSAATLEEMASPLVMCDLEGWRRGFGLGLELARVGDRVLVGHGGAMPGYLTGLRVSRAGRVGAVVFANVTAGAEPSVLAGRLVETVLDAEPTPADPWAPSAPRADVADIVGQWWSEGSRLVLRVDGDELWLSTPDADGVLPTRLVPEGRDRYRAAEGRERGELLEVDRDDDGVVRRLYFATYALTREPAAFSDLG